VPVRPADTADAAAVARVQAATWRTAYAGLMPAAVLDGMSEEAGTPRWSGRLAGEGWVYVAEDGGEVVGFVSGGAARDDDLPPGYGEIVALYVLPAFQGRGHGRALVAAAFGRIAASGGTACALWVLATNAAGRAFYEAHGWTCDGVERAFDLGGPTVGEVRYRISI
jgi:ribosomal protein S18 acetylase RimI-like enzyme